MPEFEIRSKIGQFLATRFVLMCNNPADDTPSNFNRAGALVLKADEVEELEWPYRTKPIVCWGTPSLQDLGISWYGPKYNDVKKKNKFKQINLMLSAGVPVIPAAKSAMEAKSFGLSDKVIKRTLAHSEGRNVEIITENFSDEEDDEHYYRPLLNFKNEYRVHIIKDKVVAIAHKHKEVNNTINETANIIRSYDNGWRFAMLDEDFLSRWRIKDKVISASKKAIAAVGYDFGAVDIGVVGLSTDPNVKVYVIEVNSAPGLEAEHIELYAKEFEKPLIEQRR